MKLLENKVAIITGSSSGIGKGIALAFAESGATVVITSRSFETAQTLSEEIRASGHSAFTCAYDLNEPESGVKLIDTVAEQFGQVDILVNNAISRTVIAPGTVQGIPYEQMSEGITTNFTNVLALTARCHGLLQKSCGVVLNIGSVVVNRHMTGVPLYTILKGALSQTTKTLAAEWAADRIRVNQINPGFVVTDTLAQSMPPEILSSLTEIFQGNYPLGRVGTVADVAGLALYMVSKQASWMTGSIVDLDGGYSIEGVPFPNLA